MNAALKNNSKMSTMPTCKHGQADVELRLEEQRRAAKEEGAQAEHEEGGENLRAT